MIYPSVGQYTEAIKLAEQSPEDYFATMTTLRPVLGADGNPVMSSGNFAVVFKMEDQNDGKIYALKCFTRDQEGRNESYRLIADELKDVSSPYITNIQYLEKELFVDTNTDENEFPVLLMDWVEGETLDKYIRHHIDDQYALSMLAYKFSRLAIWLMTQSFAHGDLKPDNIIVRSDGTLTLVDYDGMFVPAMSGQKSRELGSPDFRHPNRTEDDFDEHLDDFSLSTIMLSLKAIALQPSLLEEYGASDRLLFSQNDYRKISECGVLDAIKRLTNDSELTTLLSMFLIALTHKNFDSVSLEQFNIAKTEIEDIPEEELSTEVTKEEIENGVKDEFGVVYSKDGRRLLKCYYNGEEYVVREGTMVICDDAFGWRKHLQRITIPDSVKSIGPGFLNFSGVNTIICKSKYYEVNNKSLYSNGGKTLHSYFGIESKYVVHNDVTKIGNYAFSSCESLQSVTIPESVTSIGNRAFYMCKALQNVVIPDSITSIGESVFSRCKALQNIAIPDSVTYIGKSAFSGCESLRNITIPDSVTKIGKYAFGECISLQKITISNNVTIIDDGAFLGCSFLRNINIPDSINVIGDYAFSRCKSLYSITISDNITKIGAGFISYSGVKRIICNSQYYGVYKNGLYSKTEKSMLSYLGSESHFHIPNGVTSICGGAFGGCKSLQSISIPNSVVSIGESAFNGCSSLQSITIPDSVKSIGYHAFAYCASLQSITIPNNVTVIEKCMFMNCHALHSITILGNITNIDNSAFHTCGSLQNITIPNSVTNIGRTAFWGCSSLQRITIPNRVASIGDEIFADCKSLQEIIISDNLECISTKAFAGCESLQSITIPNSVSRICNSAFCDCKSLQNIIIPNSVASIGDYAFSHCRSLQRITIPNSVTNIGDYAFHCCNSLQSITFPASNIKIGVGIFAYCSSLQYIYIPKGTRKIFKRLLPRNKTSLLVEQTNQTYNDNNLTLF